MDVEHLRLQTECLLKHLDAIQSTNWKTVGGDWQGTLHKLQPAIDALADLQATIPPLKTTDLRCAVYDGQVHDPLGGGSYYFKEEYIASHVRYLGLPVASTTRQVFAPSTLQIHIGAQPNNSPHSGTITVFILAFLIARDIKAYYKALREHNHLPGALSSWIDDLQIAVQLDIVDTAPHNDENRTHDGIRYQKSLRLTQALRSLLPDYEAVMQSAKDFVEGEIPYTITYQEDLTTLPSVPSIVNALVKDRERLGWEISPKTGKLAIRRACPHPGCGLAEKHGVKNEYSASSGNVVIRFHCPDHGYHSIDTSNPHDVATLEFNTPLRNLVRALAYGLEMTQSREAAQKAITSGGIPVREKVHMRVTGADYMGTYSEQFLWRQLMLVMPGEERIPPPVVVYAPLIQDWAGSKLSKSLYVVDGAYEYLKVRGMGYLLSFAEMKRMGKDHSVLFREVERWLKEPKKLFRPYSIEYLHSVFEKERVLLHT